MSDGTKIEWADATWPVTRGCSLASAGCEKCYAMKMAHRFSGPGRWGHGLTVLGKHGPRWNGTVRTVPEALGMPLRWRKPRRVFVSSTSDLFHPEVPFQYIAAVLGVAAACPQHDFQFLTKRAERMAEFFRWLGAGDIDPVEELRFQAQGCFYDANDDPVHTIGRGKTWPLPNVHLGVSTENQEAADERIGPLLECPAAVHFISAEPLIGPIQLRPSWLAGYDFRGGYKVVAPRLSWVIAGGESGPGARPCHVEWIRSIVEQCREGGVPAFVKQLGAHVRWNGPSASAEPWPEDAIKDAIDDGQVGWRVPLKHRKGADMEEWPEDLRLREMPGGVAYRVTSPAPGGDTSRAADDR